MFPVEVAYLKAPVADYVQAAVDAVFNIHLKVSSDHVLSNLAGTSRRYPRLPHRKRRDRRGNSASGRSGAIVSSCNDSNADDRMPAGGAKILALPLYATLPTEEQEIIFDPPPRDTRKVIFSTNIAEASVTIDGIKYVVDSGFVKVRLDRIAQLIRSSKPSIPAQRWTSSPSRRAPLHQRTKERDEQAVPRQASVSGCIHQASCQHATPLPRCRSQPRQSWCAQTSACTSSSLRR